MCVCVRILRMVEPESDIRGSTADTTWPSQSSVCTACSVMLTYSADMHNGVGIALAHLILAFEFAPSKKKVVWRLGTIVAPWVEGSAAGRPELPVMMSCTAA